MKKILYTQFNEDCDENIAIVTKVILFTLTCDY